MEAPPATILHVDAERGFSGGEVQVFHLMRGLQERGWKQMLIAPPGSMALERIPEGLESAAVAMRNNADLAAVWRLRGLFKQQRREGPVVVHLHTGRSTWLGAWAARGLDVKVISTRRMDRRVKRGWGTRVLYQRLVDRVVGISGPVTKGLLDAGVPPERASTIFDCVGEMDLSRAAGDRKRVRGELGLGQEQFVLLVLARLDRRKGIDILLEAMHLVRKEAGLDSLRARNQRAQEDARKGVMADPNAAPIPSTPMPHLVIAGDGPEFTALGEQAKQLKLDQHVTFLGQRRDAPALLAACDVMALPSRFEGLGVASLEAMASGKAVIATRVGGLAEAVLDGRTGLLVESENVRELAGAIIRLSGDPDLCQRLGAAGPARIEEAYTVAGMVSGYEQLYRDR